MSSGIEPVSSRAPHLVARLADLMIEIGLGGLVLSLSPSVRAIIGHDPATIEGRPALDFVHPLDRVRMTRHFLRLARARRPARSTPIRLRIQHADGRWIWVEGNPASMPDEATGGSIGWVDVLRNIEATIAQDEAQRLARRTAEAESAAQADFLANISHEIRTPLNSIIGFMQVLKRDGSLGEVQLGHVGRVEEAGRNLLTVVNDVLDLSKIESGVLHLNARPFSPARLMADAAALIRPQAVEKGLRLDIDGETLGGATVIGDPDRLRQALLNLLSNAVKFTLQGEVRLTLKVRPADSLIDLAFAVEDTGVGIASEQLPKLFRRFTQADGSIARRFGGTGLGLAISKRLVEAMGGSIEVQSRPDIGSRFVIRLRLPLADRQGGSLPGGGATRLSAPARSATLHDRRLLVAEDVPINQKLVEAMLAPLGCPIDFVADGAEALHAVQNRLYALVLMDMQMPVLDGIEASRAIRALGGAFADLPIVALTANAFPEQIAQAREAGMNDVITKPIDSDHLVATVTKWALRSPVSG